MLDADTYGLSDVRTLRTVFPRAVVAAVRAPVTAAKIAAALRQVR
ncbi:MAG TPA: hypothetical protein VH108_08850 [Gaiellaceae bacterium]|nr:hypothetical protein [Gaiellaceae bacterium]